MTSPEPPGAPYRRPVFHYFPDDQPGYRVTVDPLPDGAYYWHLWYYGERVNGGLSGTLAEAFKDGNTAAFRNALEKIGMLPGWD